MNKRLTEIYKNIEKSNKKDFLENNITIEEQWGNPVWGIALQVQLSNKLKKKIKKIQEDLEKIEPGIFYSLPCEFQHISFNQVVHWNGVYKKGKEETWNNIKNEFINEFKKLNNQYISFNIVFNKIIATKGAIIYCAQDNQDSLETLRNEFFLRLPFPSETTYKSHIVHTTLSRYKNKLNNPEKIVDYLSKYQLKNEMKIEKIDLINELVFPSIKTKKLFTINLVK